MLDGGSERRGTLSTGGFWLAAGGLLLAALGAPGLRGSEDRFAEIAREMVLYADYLHPTLNGESHFHKPLLSYWAIVVAGRVLGTMNEWAARLPSALAGLVALAATLRLGREVWNPVVGRTAGWVLLGMYGFLFWARTAAADMENLAAIVLAVAWFRCREAEATTFFYLVFALICALGAHAKGLAAIVVPLLVLAPHLASAGRWRRHLRVRVVPAIVVGLVVYLLPFVWAEMTRADGGGVSATLAGDPQSGLYMVFQENVRRFYAPHDHREPAYTYVFALPLLLLPWSLVFLGGLATWIRERRHAPPEDTWLVSAIVLIFVFFTAAGSRRSYYILPILPFCALLVARVLCEVPLPSGARHVVSWTRTALAMSAALLLLGAAGMPLLGWWSGVDVPFAAVLAVAAPALLALGVWRGRGVLAKPCAAALGVTESAAVPVLLSVLLLGAYFTLQYPIADRFRTEKPFALALRDAAAGLPPGRVAFVWHVPSLFPFYMEQAEPIVVLRDEASVRAFRSEGPGILVASPRTLARLDRESSEPFARPPDLREAHNPWDPPDERYGAWVLSTP